MPQQHKQLRAWCAGKTQPPEEVLTTIENIDPKPEILYDQSNIDGSTGELADVMKGLYDKMDSLKRNPDEFRAWTEEDGHITFYDTLLDLTPNEIRLRVNILQQLGTFKFRSGLNGDTKKQLISEIFAPQEEDEDPNIFGVIRARKLFQIWTPPDDSLLKGVISQPAQVGRFLSDRLSPSNRKAFRLVGHPLHEVRSTDLQVVRTSKTVAFERNSEIHLIIAVKKVLEQWDADAITAGGVAKVNLLETLLLHELIELTLDEGNPEMDALASHIVATTFERYLKGTTLTVAAEDFFLEWPPLSTAELEDREEAQLAQEIEEANARLNVDDFPNYDEEDLEDLPFDTAIPTKKKKSTVKKKKKKSAKRNSK